ncbi:glycoprotein 3-alpha-L-fucosyltransferase A-like [Dermacentor albipictus]|uniref:glycoprotein 3-alpha-L-fucosyltransferase A-like n=1 Tax=Dermacentor albipictus TaxID=60249 RepID=UPI0031FE1752
MASSRRRLLVRHAGGLRRCVLAAVLASGFTLVVFQLNVASKQSTPLPWMSASQDGNGTESRTERARRIMERQIFRDNERADHRHDDPAPSWSRSKLPWFFTNGTEWPRPSSRLSRLPNVWPDPQSPHDDRIVSQLMYLPPGYKGQPKSINTTYIPENEELDQIRNDSSMKTILLDGSWYDFLSGQTLFLRDRCPVDKCRVYRKRASQGYFASADAIIFKDGFGVGPDTSKGNQVWILYLLENPLHSYVAQESSGIDWTATYRKDSDIVTPYEKFVLFDPLVKTIKRDYDYAQNKTKMVAWFVSNCAAANGRLEYAKKLGQYIQVDIYGSCGPLSCPRDQSERCYQMLDMEYLFYLSFENANCKDYITEKFFNALRHNVVPVVMGASREDYLAAAPYHSYIHVDDFGSPKELAEYLQLLSRNRTLYNQYFEWKGTGEFVNTYFWCRLCAMLHAPPAPAKRRTQSVRDWWRKDACASTIEQE